MAFGLVLLAAGESTRMGQPKQLLKIGGATLVERAADAALASRAWPVVVVLGNAANAIRPLLAKRPLLLVENPDWREGLGTSIRAGIQILDRFSNRLDGAVIALADQPRLSAAAIDALATAAPGSDMIVASRYAEAIGAPVYFPRGYFDTLRALAPNEGAQRLLQSHAGQVVALDRPELALDLDTPADYEQFLRETGG